MSPAVLAPGLYLVATPIGNAGDLSERARQILIAADVIACEDTRVTAKLLALHQVRTPTTAYHQHNAERVRPKLLQRLAEGAVVALVSDAGTPLISDPGYKLVRACVEASLTVTAIPGPCAAIAALTLSGLPTDRFFFQGFLPEKSAARRRALSALVNIPASLIFYESPRRLAASLADMADLLGNRGAAVARELTKFHEQVQRQGLSELAHHYAAAKTPRGEIVVVVGPPLEATDEVTDRDLIVAIDDALARLSLRDAVSEVAITLDLPRTRVYRLALTRQKSRHKSLDHGR